MKHCWKQIKTFLLKPKHKIKIKSIYYKCIINIISYSNKLWQINLHKGRKEFWVKVRFQMTFRREMLSSSGLSLPSCTLHPSDVSCGQSHDGQNTSTILLRLSDWNGQCPGSAKADTSRAPSHLSILLQHGTLYCAILWTSKCLELHQLIHGLSIHINGRKTRLALFL